MSVDSNILAPLGLTSMYVPVDLVPAIQALITTHRMRGRKYRVIEDYCKGLAVAWIANKHGISQQGVCNIVRRAGVKPRRNRRAQRDGGARG